MRVIIVVSFALIFLVLTASCAEIACNPDSQGGDERKLCKAELQTGEVRKMTTLDEETTETATIAQVTALDSTGKLKKKGGRNLWRRVFFGQRVNEEQAHTQGQGQAHECTLRSLNE